MMVEVLESSFVVPSEQTPTERLWLSNLDQVAAPKHIGFLYFYEGKQANDFFSLEILKASLSKTLVLFYPLAGRCVVGQDGRKEINCNAEGCLFVAARTDLTSDSITFEPSSTLKKLFVPCSEFPGSLSPLFMVQVTYLKSGGVVLGTAIYHILADGFSKFYFMQTWARIARGDVDNIIRPSFESSLLRARSPPSIRYNPPELVTAHPAAAPTSLVTTKFKLTKEQVDTFKSQHSGGNKNTKISSFSTIAALLWKCYCISRGLALTTQARLFFTANIRQRLYPPLPKTYFGNAVVRTAATCEVSQIISNPVNIVAESVQVAIDGITDEFIRSAIDFLEVMPKKSLPPPELVDSDLRIGSISGLPVYEADFGWGAPQKASQAEAIGNNVIYVLDEPGKNTGWQAYVTLDATIMPQFEKAFHDELVTCSS